MIYKQRNPLGPTLLALAIVVAGAGVLAVTAGHAPAYSSTAAAADATDPNLTASGQGAGTSGTDPTGATASAATDNSPDAAILAAISQVNAINLDASVLNNPSFVSFTSFIRATPEPAGRSNPFAPLAGLIASSSSVSR